MIKCITTLMTNNASVWPHLEATFYCWGCVRNWSKKGGAVIEQNWKAFQPRRVHKCGMPDLDDRLMSQIWLSKSFFYVKNLSEFFFIEEYQFRRSFFLLLSFFKNFNFWTTLFYKMVPNFWRSLCKSVKVKSKKYLYFTDSFAKIYSLLTHAHKTPPLRSHYS